MLGQVPGHPTITMATRRALERRLIFWYLLAPGSLPRLVGDQRARVEEGVAVSPEDVGAEKGGGGGGA